MATPSLLFSPTASAPNFNGSLNLGSASKPNFGAYFPSAPASGSPSFTLPNSLGALPTPKGGVTLVKNPATGIFQGRTLPTTPPPQNQGQPNTTTVAPATSQNDTSATVGGGNTSTGNTGNDYDNFVANVMQLMKQATTVKTAADASLGGAQNTLVNESVSPNGPATFNPNVSSGVQVENQKTLQDSFQPGIASINTQMENENANFSNLSGFAASVLGSQKAQGFPYNERIAGPGGQPINGGANVLPAAAEAAVTLQAQLYQGNKTNLNSVESALSAYGQPALDEFYKKINGTNINSAEGNATFQSQQVGTIAAMQSAYQQGHNLQSQLIDLITTTGVNGTDVNAMNAAAQKIAANVSDPNYKALSNYVTDLVATYSNILTPGANTDAAKAAAASLLDPTAGGASIITTLRYLDAQAQAKIAGTAVDPKVISWLTNGGSRTTSGTSSAGSGGGKITSWSQLTNR